MKTSVVVFALLLVCVFARDYKVYKTKDWTGHDVKHVDFTTVEDMMKTCDETTDCIGFNTHGWLKKAGGSLTNEPAVDLYLLSSIYVPTGVEPELTLWPKPNNYKNGNSTITIDMKNIELKINIESEDGEKAFERFKELLYVHSASDKKYLIHYISAEIVDAKCPLQQDVDESYSLEIPEDSDVITIHSQCIYGYYHALHTLSQLVQYKPSEHQYVIKHAPWSIQDKPFFSFRGVMIDSSRHFLPVKGIKSLIDNMSYYKLNVLHWHISDEQSFPMEIEGIDMFPSSFSAYERYSLEDTEEVVEYARQRGIRVLPEIDVPGHAAIWCKSDPSICPSETCLTPLNPTNEHTFEVIELIIKSIVDRFPEAYFHIGGDEVDTGCWKNTPEIADWMKEKGYTIKDTYSYFVNRVYEIVKKYSRQAVYWEEVYNSGLNVPKDSIIELWLGNKQHMKKVVESGYRGIFSNYYQWYLPQLWEHWELIYNANFIEGITDPEQLKMVLGGEVCMWGEKADISAVERVIWPRAAAAAERLWTNPELLNVEEANGRIAYQRCLMNWRSIPASPTYKDGRSDPSGPNSCFME
ncbi:hypothetical protein WA158_005999 [Blastocystis sp. Blastoise]